MITQLYIICKTRRLFSEVLLKRKQAEVSEAHKKVEILKKLKEKQEQEYYKEFLDSEVKEISIFSTKTKKKLCSRQIDSEGFETYYVFEMPDDDERRAAKPIQKFTLNTKEEVQAFINIMNKFLNKQ